MTDKPVLQALLGEGEVEAFFCGHWPDRIYAVHGPKDRLPSPLLDAELNDFDALSNRYRGVVSFFANRERSHMVPVDGIHPGAPYQCGLSVYLADVSTCFPDVAAMIRSLEAELGVNEGCSRAGVFASPTRGGIACHFDAADVISIQLKGTKRFDLAPVTEIPYPWGDQYHPGNRPQNDLYPQATSGFPEWRTAEFQSVDMQPGSVLYMPRGTWHRTEASEDSIALSIGISPPSAAECVLDQLRLVMLQDPEWRKPLYGAWSDDGMRESAMSRAASLISDMPRLAAALRPEMLALPSLPEDSRITRIGPESCLQRAPNATVTIESSVPEGVDTPAPEHVVVTIGVKDYGIERVSAQVEMPVSCVPVLEWLGEQGASFQVAELIGQFPGLKPAQHLELLRLLVRTKLLTLYWFPRVDPAPP
jgi:hypothetical protein